MATPKKSASKKSSGSRNSQSARAGLRFPVAKVGRIVRKAKYTSRLSAGAAVYIAGVLEYWTSETLGLAQKVTKNKQRITPRSITLAIRNDEELGSLLSNVTIARGGVLVTGGAKTDKKKKSGKKGGKKGKKAAASGEKKPKAAKKSGSKKTAKK